MGELSRIFVHCLNHWRLEVPNAWKQHNPNGDYQAYRTNYIR